MLKLSIEKKKKNSKYDSQCKIFVATKKRN